MKGKFTAILLVLLLMCGCARAEGKYEGEWNGGVWTFNVEDGVISGLIDIIEEAPYTVVWDDSLKEDPFPISTQYSLEACPEGYRYDANGEWKIFEAQADGSYLFTKKDGTPAITLLQAENGRMELRKHWSFWADYVHGQDPQTCMVHLDCCDLDGFFERIYAFVLEDGVFTPYYVVTGKRVPDENGGPAKFEIVGLDGDSAFFYLDEREDGTARYEFWFNIDDELIHGNSSFDLIRAEDGSYRGEGDILRLFDDDSFAYWGELDWYYAFGAGMNYAYESGVLTVWEYMRSPAIRLEVTEDGVSLQIGDNTGYARRVTN